MRLHVARALLNRHGGESQVGAQKRLCQHEESLQCYFCLLIEGREYRRRKGKFCHRPCYDTVAAWLSAVESKETVSAAVVVAATFSLAVVAWAWCLPNL